MKRKKQNKNNLFQSYRGEVRSAFVPRCFKNDETKEEAGVLTVSKPEHEWECVVGGRNQWDQCSGEVSSKDSDCLNSSFSSWIYTDSVTCWESLSGDWKQRLFYHRVLFPKQTFFSFRGEIRLLGASCRDAIVIKPATLDGAEYASHKKRSKGYIFTTDTDRKTDGRTAGENHTGWLQLSRHIRKPREFFFVCFFYWPLAEKKENYLCLLREKRRTILVFALKVKANSTQCFGRQHHKTAN